MAFATGVLGCERVGGQGDVRRTESNKDQQCVASKCRYSSVLYISTYGKYIQVYGLHKYKTVSYLTRISSVLHQSVVTKVTISWLSKLI